MKRVVNTLEVFQLFGNPLELWIVAILSAVFALLIVHLVRRLARVKFAKARHTITYVDDVVLELARRTRLVLIGLVLFNVSFRLLELPPKVSGAMRAVAVVSFFIQLGLWLAGGVNLFVRHYRRTHAETDTASSTITLAAFMGKVALWALVVLVTLDNLGINITALVTGLGIGGVAVALAMQNILGDLFASLSILVDKPFVVGDLITVGDQVGRVKSVGLKTTRVTSLNGEELVFSNGDLLNSRIRNFSVMRERRVLFTFGVTYETTREQLAMIPSIVRTAVEKRELTRFDRAHFKAFGPHSYDFEVVYFVLSPDLPVQMDAQQAINLDLVSEFAANGIAFAYPTQTLYLSRVPSTD